MGIFQGWFGEKLVTFNMWLNLDANTYQRLHNVILPSKNGTAQIDHLLISPYGIFIVETKNIQGWIFGDDRQSTWTQVLYGHKYPFQNPVRQTFRQRKVLSEYLSLDETLIHTVIYFVSDCKFKTHLPSNVINSGLSSHIKQYQRLVLLPQNISQIQNKLNELVLNTSLTTKNHVRSLHERYSSITVCPKCGSKLVARVAKQGRDAGAEFLGCANYPKCRFTKNMSH